MPTFGGFQNYQQLPQFMNQVLAKIRNWLFSGDTDLKVRSIVLEPSAVDGSPVEGQLYYDSTANKLLVYNGAAWETITSSV